MTLDLASHLRPRATRSDTPPTLSTGLPLASFTGSPGAKLCRSHGRQGPPRFSIHRELETGAVASAAGTCVYGDGFDPPWSVRPIPSHPSIHPPDQGQGATRRLVEHFRSRKVHLPRPSCFVLFSFLRPYAFVCPASRFSFLQQRPCSCIGAYHSLRPTRHSLAVLIPICKRSKKRSLKPNAYPLPGPPPIPLDPVGDSRSIRVTHRLDSSSSSAPSAPLSPSPQKHQIQTKMGLIDTLRSKYELYRLEQRYTRREKRTTFASGATYVDGEYVYRNGRPPLSPGEGAPNDDEMPPPTAVAAVAKSVSSSSGASTGPSSPVSPGSESKGPWGRVPDDAWGAR
ncbi:hypothetical protein ANO11243_036920 [Dothideomycetidae sp. 11243]|nr:hypothetical protein ANO11243_036920 [fungal sp. No.11243]